MDFNELEQPPPDNATPGLGPIPTLEEALAQGRFAATAEFGPPLIPDLRGSGGRRRRGAVPRLAAGGFLTGQAINVNGGVVM